MSDEVENINAGKSEHHSRLFVLAVLAGVVLLAHLPTLLANAAYVESKFLRAHARSILEYKLRLSAVFFALHLDVLPYRLLVDTNC